LLFREREPEQLQANFPPASFRFEVTAIALLERKTICPSDFLDCRLRDEQMAKMNRIKRTAKISTFIREMFSD